jgi:glycosyltransferase involved in cell wall biosynthesis
MITTSNEKIKCTVGILTLNSEKGLAACLESFKNFEEIIICDGNSTDSTLEIAKNFGARIIKQYESLEKNIPCVKDKDTVRQKNMEASTSEWYFFMDADDTLSQEAVEEIRMIVSDKNPKHLIYRMPTRIFIEQSNGENKEVKYEATYPSYQVRLVHKSVNAKFKGKVHDHLVWDQKKFTVGTMKSFYNFVWPRERILNFWKYSSKYAKWEVETGPSDRSFLDFMYWVVYRRLKTIFGYLLYRLPKMYVLHGFKDSMPISIELDIVRYHCLILILDIKKYVKG